jgi:hypothetical protein
MATTLAATALPLDLRDYEEDLEEALRQPVRDTWDESAKFTGAVQAAAIGAVLVRALHTNLAEFAIGYVFREKIAKRGQTTLAQASKVSGKLAYFSDYDFLIEVNWETWRRLTGPQRVALIDHELCHFARGESDKGDVVKQLLGHDVEEFNAIVSRWGLWKGDLAIFGNHVRNAPQFDLFSLATEGEEEGRD